MSYERRPDPDEYHPDYAGYVERVPGGDIIAILAIQIEDTVALLRELSDEQALHAYAPGKWTIKEVIGHVTDAERVFAYRALRFARGDATPLPGFDEKSYAPAGRFVERPLASLTAELVTVRRATVALLAGLPDEAWTRAGPANHAIASVRALAWIMAGHELHHREVLSRRYLQGPGPRFAI